MVDKDPAVLERSKDPQLLMKTAVEFASSEYPADHSFLPYFLGMEEFLYRLDTPDEYLAPPKQLRLARVLKALMTNPSPHAKQVLVLLTRQDGFLARDERQLLLIQALVEVRPAPADAVSFWDQNSQPDSPYLTVTAIALADNGSPNALALLERKITDPEIAPDVKVSWMRQPILVHRNEAVMLESCGRMLAGPMALELRPALVEVLFDYQPAWYVSHPPVPPPRSTLNPQARNLLRTIGKHTLQSIPLDPSLKMKVQLALEEIGGAG
jgi:hypothetical protein